jgi:hypothetical protein
VVPPAVSCRPSLKGLSIPSLTHKHARQHDGIDSTSLYHRPTTSVEPSAIFTSHNRGGTIEDPSSKPPIELCLFSSVSGYLLQQCDNLIGLAYIDGRKIKRHQGHYHSAGTQQANLPSHRILRYPFATAVDRPNYIPLNWLDVQFRFDVAKPTVTFEGQWVMAERQGHSPIPQRLILIGELQSTMRHNSSLQSFRVTSEINRTVIEEPI